MTQKDDLQKVKEVIINIMNEQYIQKEKIFELIFEEVWKDEKDYRKRYCTIVKKLLNLVGKEEYELWEAIKGNKNVL